MNKTSLALTSLVAAVPALALLVLLILGFFSDPGATSDPAFPGAAGMTYSLQDGGGTTEVSGALVFGNP